jgi:hypothetical protein
MKRFDKSARVVMVNTLLTLVLAFILVEKSVATNYFVYPGGKGAKSGLDWNNAWDIGGVGWSKLVAGDIVWMAGGTYTSWLSPSKGGNASNPIFVKRVRSTDSAATASAGWNSSYDSQVILSSGFSATANNAADYFYIDGRIDGGIWFRHSANDTDASVIANTTALINYLTLTNVWASAAGESSPYYNYSGDTAVVNFNAGAASPYPSTYGLYISHCKLFGALNIFKLMNVYNSTIENTEMYYTGITSGNPGHPNIVNSASTGEITWRYNNIHDYASEGIMFEHANAQNWYIYGNIWHDGLPGTYPRILETQSGTSSGIYFYNNTIAGNNWINIRSVGNTWGANCISKNNLMVNETGGCSDTGWTTANNLSTGSGVVVNYASKDFHIIATTGSSYPRNGGVNLGAPYNYDKDRNIRGADGVWDVGAYEYSAGTVQTMLPPSNMQVIALH